MKEIIAVYQDCVLCGVKGRKKVAEYAENGIEIRKVSFISEEGRKLCEKAINMGIGSMPFYIDSKKHVFATSIDELLKEVSEKPAKSNKKSLKKTKKGKGNKHGNDSKV